MRLKVMYIDDELDLCDCFLDAFTTKDIQILTFTDPNDAADELKNSPPDVLFIDFRLKGTTGDKVAHSLDPNIPKYLISGDIDVKTSYPFIKVFSKPMPPEKVRAFLNELLDQKKNDKQAA